MDRKYGSMEYPDYVDSLSALYIIYKAFDYPNVQTWKQNYYLFVMLINGISSCLAHSPLIDKYLPKLSYLMDQIDLYSIAITLIISPLFVSPIPLLVKLILILINFTFSIKLIQLNIIDLYTGIFIYPVITIICIFYYYKQFDVYTILISCLALFFKLNQKVKFFHSSWHIFGTIMLRQVYYKLASI
tara:strand:- start:103 stop:663 length:561 start_codon:yes stop_codon:yes gene_type:complete